MAIVAGIDEAGYGPVLGPLVVSGTAFRVSDDLAERCLWSSLKSTCARESARGSRKLVIADSKKLYRSGSGEEGLAALERGVLVMLAAAGIRPGRLDELLEALAPGALEASRTQPWYGSLELALPHCELTGDIGTRANAVVLEARSGGLGVLPAVCEPLLEDAFNRRVRATQNKGIVLLGQVLRIIERIRRFAPEETLFVHVDRLGGRAHYREWIALSWPGNELAILEESETRSAYRIRRDRWTMHLDFTVGGESVHLPVALASMVSKYIRELYMKVFNAYWSGLERSLKPTAGYYTDAQRWMSDAAPVLARTGVDRSRLVRER